MSDQTDTQSKNMLVKLKIQYMSSDMCFCVFALKLKANDFLLSNRRWPAGCMAACTRTVPHGNNMIIKALSTCHSNLEMFSFCFCILLISWLCWTICVFLLCFTFVLWLSQWANCRSVNGNWAAASIQGDWSCRDTVQSTISCYQLLAAAANPLWSSSGPDPESQRPVLSHSSGCFGFQPERTTGTWDKMSGWYMILFYASLCYWAAVKEETDLIFDCLHRKAHGGMRGEVRDQGSRLNQPCRCGQKKQHISRDRSVSHSDLFCTNDITTFVCSTVYGGVWVAETTISDPVYPSSTCPVLWWVILVLILILKHQTQSEKEITVSEWTVGFSGLSVSDVTVNSSGLLHTIELQHFHQVLLVSSLYFMLATLSLCSHCSTTSEQLCVYQVYQAFRINIASQCKVPKGKSGLVTQAIICAHVEMWYNLVLVSAERLSNVYRIMVPWFQEDSLTTARWVFMLAAGFICQVALSCGCSLNVAHTSDCFTEELTQCQPEMLGTLTPGVTDCYHGDNQWHLCWHVAYTGL